MFGTGLRGIGRWIRKDEEIFWHENEAIQFGASNIGMLNTREFLDQHIVTNSMLIVNRIPMGYNNHGFKNFWDQHIISHVHCQQNTVPVFITASDV